jgi:hypothetical protein
MFGGRVFQQTVGIPMGTNCAPLLADLFLYSYEADSIHGLLKKNEKKLTRCFNITNMLSIKNSNMLMISVSENFLVESEWFLYKIRSVSS